VVDAGSTEAEIDENKLTADWSGTVKLQATIEDGTAEGTDFTKEFTIEVKPVVTGVEITMPRGDTVYRNNSFILNAEVKGAGGTGSVTWTLTGASSTHTGIIDGVLTVGEDETAATLTIRATSDFDPTKYGEKVYKVADPKVVSAIELSGRPPLNGQQTNSSRLICDTEGVYPAYIFWYKTDGTPVSVIETGTEYLGRFEVELEDGYVFPSDGVVAITYNGQPLEMIADDKSYSDYHPNGSYTVDERQFALGYVYAKAVDSATQTVVKNLDLTVGQPVAGQPAPQASTAFEGVGSVETLWSLVDPNGRYIIAEEFEAGKTYVCRITVTLNDGYLFPENGELDAVTINGKKIPFNPSDEAEAGGYWAGTEVVGTRRS
jgi:hypothetical protein